MASKAIGELRVRDTSLLLANSSDRSEEASEISQTLFFVPGLKSPSVPKASHGESELFFNLIHLEK